MNYEAHDPEAGLTLVEVLVTVLILGTAVAALLGSMAMSIVSSNVHRKQAVSETVMRSVADYVEFPPCVVTSASCPTAYPNSAYKDCTVAGAPDYLQGFSTIYGGAAGYTVTVTGRKYWNGTDFVASCPSVDLGLQLVSLKVSTGGTEREANETLDIVKRRP